MTARSHAHPLLKKLLAIIIFFLFSSIAIYTGASNESGNIQTLPSTTMDAENQDLHLLRVEHYLYVNASEDTDTFHIRYSVPPDYQYQVPLMVELYNDSTLSKIVHYQIENDTYEPNKIINFTIEALEKDESVLLHFSCWVLVKNHDYNDLPAYVKIPKKCQLPDETKIWLASTDVVQTKSLLIRLKAQQLHGLSDNLIRYASRIAPFIRNHRFILFVIELKFGLLFSQDARTTLFINGENVGRSHLACAFFRVYNIPARVILVNNDQGFWTQMHYMVEYYCPGYGWVLVETTAGKTPYETKRQVVNRVCYPEDEQDTKDDYIFPFMKGEERWLWIDTENVVPYYVDCDKGSKSQMFSETVVSVDPLTGEYAFVLSQMVFHLYQKYLGENLSDENNHHFLNATGFQHQAILSLKQSQQIDQYLGYMNQAYDEYNEIHL